MSVKTEEYKNFVDFPKGLRLLNKNVKLYVKLLGTFAKAGYLEGILTSYESKDIAETLAKLHSIKGVSANLALFQISGLSAKLEALIKDTGTIPSDQKHIEDLKSAYIGTLTVIEDVSKNPDLILSCAEI